MAENKGNAAAGNGTVNAQEIRAQMGQLNVETSNETIKKEVSTFNEGGIYIGLKIVSEYDEATGQYKEERPSLVTMIDGKFVNFPQDVSYEGLSEARRRELALEEYQRRKNFGRP